MQESVLVALIYMYINFVTFVSLSSPALAANLWDVTDVDIDRFYQALLKSWPTPLGGTFTYET